MMQQPVFKHARRRARFGALCLLAAVVLLFAPPAQADGWEAAIPNTPYTPRRVLAVDKGEQTFHLIERQSPPAVVASFPCTTGQREGDKLIEGDQKTPEGIYFIDRKLTSGLDREMYGGIAYTLNYPNPVDKLRGKTGYGIWIHSKGREIVPMETQGCIALNLPDIGGLDPMLAHGTPVAVAQHVLAGTDNCAAAGNPDELARQALRAEEAVELTRRWAAAWASRSHEFFNLYDGNAYTKAQGSSFTIFKSQKERLFATLPWIHTFAADVQSLSGPGYWVTWFNQYYRAPNLTVEGVRRLYWQEDKDGALRIVGMEWKPADLGLERRYLDEFVRPSVGEFVSGWQKAWQNADLNAYMTAYDTAARQGKLRNSAAIEAHKGSLWQQVRPVRVEFSEPDISWAPEGLTVQMRQIYEDSSGYSDTGTKILVLAPQGAGWQILREDWKASR